MGQVLADDPSAITSPVPSLPLPLDHDEYQKYRQSTSAAYTASMNEYDRLVTWASAGALAVSMSFLEKFGNKADPRTAWLLGLSWSLLAGSFAMSLWSQYFSSRAHSWALRKLDHQQIAAAERKPDWAAQAKRLEGIGHRYGKATRWLTFLSGIALVEVS